MPKLLAALLAAALAAPCRAASASVPDIHNSSAPARVEKPAPLRWGAQKAVVEGQGKDVIGVGAGIAEGKPLEMAVWSGGGAVTGSIFGPVGAVVGAAAGAVVGLCISVFVMPRVMPPPAQPKPRT